MKISAYRYRLIPTRSQRSALARWAGCARWVYNAALAERERVYRTTGKGAGYAALCRALAGWRAEHDWLRAAPSQVGQQAARDLTDAYTRFFKKQNSRPTFKRKGKSRDSFRIPNQNSGKSKLLRIERSNRRRAQLKLPKIGWVRLHYSRAIQGEIRNVTISRDGGQWFVSVLCGELGEHPAPPESISGSKTVGLDLGVAQSITTSDGEALNVPTMSAGDERHRKRLQRRMSRRQGPRKGKAPSKRWLKARDALRRFDQRWRWKRRDFIHKATTRLIRENQAISIEDLKVKNMTASVKGKGRAAKAGLNRAILAQSWGEIRRQLSYKAERAGVRLLVVDPAYTSQKCAVCGHIERSNRKTQDTFRCVRCGHAENADINAAKNILAAGLAASACGGDVRRPPLAPRVPVVDAAPMKREPIVGQQVAL